MLSRSSRYLMNIFFAPGDQLPMVLRCTQAIQQAAGVLPSQLASMMPSEKTADFVWLFRRLCRKYLNRTVWQGKPPSTGPVREPKANKVPPHGDVSNSQPHIDG